jgi:hypothetical protein
VSKIPEGSRTATEDAQSEPIEVGVARIMHEDWRAGIIAESDKASVDKQGNVIAWRSKEGGRILITYSGAMRNQAIETGGRISEATGIQVKIISPAVLIAGLEGEAAENMENFIQEIRETRFGSSMKGKVEHEVKAIAIGIASIVREGLKRLRPSQERSGIVTMRSMLDMAISGAGNPTLPFMVIKMLDAGSSRAEWGKLERSQTKGRAAQEKEAQEQAVSDCRYILHTESLLQMFNPGAILSSAWIVSMLNPCLVCPR